MKHTLKFSRGWFEMSYVNIWRQETVEHQAIPDLRDFKEVAKDLCERALQDAKKQLHPLLQNSEVSRLSQRVDFLQAFKSVLEREIARKIAAWHPGVQAVFKYDEPPLRIMEAWDGSIHLLLTVPRLSDRLKALGSKLDHSLMKHLKQLGWERFRTRQSVLEVQQVTANEIRHGIGYGGMFYAVYTAPIKIWPQEQRAR